MRIELSVK
jgi:hypothetical protein